MKIKMKTRHTKEMGDSRWADEIMGQGELMRYEYIVEMLLMFSGSITLAERRLLAFYLGHDKTPHKLLLRHHSTE